ncbi:MAG: T9SS type A sorting domain-containing protein [Deferribacteres bacterium]|nr:T9SS type A sorting domain-containing protein [Deferribacteres bacterium]
MKRKLTIFLIPVALLAFLSQNSFSQQSTITRQYTPVIFKVGQLPFAGQVIDSLVMYRYISTDGWQAIPYQFDEFNAANGRYEPEDGIADSDDEILVMPTDLGEKASGEFAPDEGVLERWEIEVSEPGSPDQKGWVYFFKKTGNEAAIGSYMSYYPDSQGTGADTVRTPGYSETHNPLNGWIADISIRQNDTYGPDLVDTQKLRVKGNVLFLSYEANETDNISFDSVRVHVGPLRIFRKLFFKIIPPSGLDAFIQPIPADIEFQYFPFSSVVSAKNATIPDSIGNIAGIKLIRQSLDLSAAAAGMKFYSDSNTDGIDIDGASDAGVNTSIPVTPDIAFLTANGDPGMLLNIFEVPKLGNSQQLYYHDNGSGSGTTADGTKDTGDKSSYGDFGIQINGDKISGQVSLDFLTYFLEKQDDPVAASNQIRDNSSTPLTVTAVYEVDTPSSIADGSQLPGQFILHDAHPNPFLPSSEAMTISFELANPANNLSVTIYNLLGQEVARIAEGQRFQAGAHTLRWNGRNQFGTPVPAGVYFYALEGRTGRQVKKVLIVR